MGPLDTRSEYREYTLRREMTLEERLAEERILFLWGEIGPNTAGGVIMRLLELQAKSPDRDINLYINSPGGSVDDTLAIYDTMQFMHCDVATYCVGQAASGAAMILAAGARGKRYALPHSKVMIHQPWGGVTGQAADIRSRLRKSSRPRSSSTSLWPSTPAAASNRSNRKPSGIGTCLPWRPRNTASWTRSWTLLPRARRKRNDRGRHDIESTDSDRD